MDDDTELLSSHRPSDDASSTPEREHRSWLYDRWGDEEMRLTVDIRTSRPRLDSMTVHDDVRRTRRQRWMRNRLDDDGCRSNISTTTTML